MSEFDAYFKWLGIPPEHQPPDHYRLLGIPAFTSDADVIASAIDRQVAHVRTFALGPHSDDNQRSMNELAAARVCLESPEKKAAYNNSLRARVPETQQVVGTSEASPTEPTSINGESTYEVLASRRTPQRQRNRTSRRRRSRTHDRRVIGIIGTATTVLVVIGLVVFLWPKTPDPTEGRDVAGTTGEQDLPVVGTSTAETRSVEKDTLRSLPMNLQQGLVAYYPFNGNANDESGNGHHGTVHGATLTSGRHGRAERAYHFNGIDNVVDSKNVLPRLDVGTVAAWVRSESDKHGVIVATNSSPAGIGLTVPGGKGVLFGLYLNRTPTISAQDNLFVMDTRDVERFYHVVGVRSGTNMTMYLDGRRITCRDIISSETMTDKPVQIGGADRRPAYFNGVIDDVRIYNRALLPEEVKALYDFEAVPVASDVENGQRRYVTTLRPLWVSAYSFTTDGRGYSADGAITVNGNPSPFGMALHPRVQSNSGYVAYKIPSGYQLLAGAVAVDDSQRDQAPTLTFGVDGGGQVLWKSPGISEKGKPVGCCVRLEEVAEIVLTVSCSSSNSATAVWLDPVLLKSSEGRTLEEIAESQRRRWLKAAP